MATRKQTTIISGLLRAGKYSLRGDGTTSRFPCHTWPGSSPAECWALLTHGDSLGAGTCTAVLDGPLSELGSRSRRRRSEASPMSTLSGPPHSFPPGPTPSAATRCISGEPCTRFFLLLGWVCYFSHYFATKRGLNPSPTRDEAPPTEVSIAALPPKPQRSPQVRAGAPRARQHRHNARHLLARDTGDGGSRRACDGGCVVLMSEHSVLERRALDYRGKFSEDVSTDASGRI